MSLNKYFVSAREKFGNRQFLYVVIAVALLFAGFSGGFIFEAESSCPDVDGCVNLGYGGVSELVERSELPSGEIELFEAQTHKPTELDAADIYEEVRPSVVEISVQRDSKVGRTRGSGFVYREGGYILTNAHVIEGSEKVIVSFYHGESIEAEIVAKDHYGDIAVLKIDTRNLDFELKPLEIGSSSDLRPGESVIAIGNPFGLAGTITTGIVSQVQRTIDPATYEDIERAYPIPAAIQIDATINPGNSGGPLLNRRGEVVGINTAIMTETGQFSGVGFAISSDLFDKVAESLIEDQVYIYPHIGVSGHSVDAFLAEERGLDQSWGFLVIEIFEGSPAEESDLEVDDLIVGVDGERVLGIEDILSYIVLEREPGDTITIDVLRDGETEFVDLVLGERPPIDSTPIEQTYNFEVDGHLPWMLIGTVVIFGTVIIIIGVFFIAKRMGERRKGGL